MLDCIWTEGKLDDALTYRHLLRSKLVLGKGLQKLNSC